MYGYEWYIIVPLVVWILTHVIIMYVTLKRKIYYGLALWLLVFLIGLAFLESFSVTIREAFLRL